VAFQFGPIAERRSEILQRLDLEPGSYAAVTAHRAENVDNPMNLSRLVTLLTEASRVTPIVLPLHPRTRGRLEAAGRLAPLEDEAGVTLIDPLGYLDFTCLLRASKVVLTDSGGAQKEAYLAGVPCVTMRERTEWVETVASGWNTLVGLDADAAVAAMRAYAELDGAAPPDPLIYGDGNAGKRVADEIHSWFGSI
jgi:UDP-N-acetylglucosamine 2-epimerase (non-hydrolysing)/UDP-GlcNAc3NAcA epimerase